MTLLWSDEGRREFKSECVTTDNGERRSLDRVRFERFKDPWIVVYLMEKLQYISRERVKKTKTKEKGARE